MKVFTGRAAELAELDRLLATVGETPTAVVISAVSGTAGVGKSALALRWAHQVRAAFPDGQLYVNLRGFDPDQPLSATDALAGFLRALGVAGEVIPLEVEERAAAYRSLLDGRRMLVVLDNASSVEQVRPLLPGAPTCVVVVTSRDSLPGLVARHGAHRLDLDLLPHEDAVALLAALIGGRVEAEPEAAAMLAELCARLPLALRVAAELAATRPTTSLAQLVSELGDEQWRLELLDAGGDAHTAVRGVFSWSYQLLPSSAARVFRLLGMHPGPDFDPWAVAALTNTGRDQAQQIVDMLARAHLIQAPRPGRYSMHDLLRAYATHLATVEDSKTNREAALTRLFDHYLATAATAMDTLIPAERHRRPHVRPPATPTPPMPDPATARAWLDAERVNLVAVTAYTATRGWPGHTVQLSTTLYRYLLVSGHFSDGLTIHTYALHAARHTGKPAGEADALNNLGRIYRQQGHYRQAADHLQQALTLAREISDRVGEVRALSTLGTVYHRQGHYQQVTDHLQQALTLARELGDRVGEAYSLLDLGTVYRDQGHYRQAADHLQQALTLARELGDRVGEAYALLALGTVYRRQGHYQQATGHLQQALTLARELGDRVGEAYALLDLGTVYRRQGHYQQATDHHEQAQGLFREVDHPHGEAYALNRVAETLLSIRQPDQARAYHAAALTLASQIGARYEQARAHNGLALTHQADGDLDQARHHWRKALAAYTNLGVPDVEDVRTYLTALDQAAENESR
ncbi:MAG TPA: tetratricopeptide repeat protein [Pseudonocardiaceae bacterium]|nr:tetratricopeptide repeat protein [Pseudonocardiaceae bacterium]